MDSEKLPENACLFGLLQLLVMRKEA